MTKDWESVRADIAELSGNQKKCLQDVRTIIESRHKFRASTRAYRMKLKEWGYTKHHRPKRTGEGQDGEQEEREEQEEQGREMELDRGDETDTTVAAEVNTPLKEKATGVVPLPAICPWSQAGNATNDILMDMLAAVLDGDSPKLEQLILANPSHVNHPIGLPFEAHGGRFFNHPAIQSVVFLQHPGQTLLDIASSLPAGPVVWVLLAHGANGSRHPLGTDLAFNNAIKNGRTFTVQSLLHTGRCSVDGLPGQSWKPLLQAAFWNVPDIVRLLLDRGAEVNDRAAQLDDMPFKTALQFALDRRVNEYTLVPVRERCEKIIKMLLDSGADIHVPPTDDQNGLSPFATFIKPWQGNPSWPMDLNQTVLDCFEAFVRKDADIQIPFHGFSCSSPSGGTFEHQVLWHSTPIASRLLIDHAVPSPGANGANMLHEILGSCPDAKQHPTDTLRDIEVLLKRGANPNHVSPTGMNPLRQCITRCPAVDIIPCLQALLNAGADLERVDRNSVPLIVLAARSFERPLVLKVFEVLLAKFQGRCPQAEGGHCSRWSEGCFPIPNDPTFVRIVRYGEPFGEFASSCQRMLPEEACLTVQQATFSVASTRFLNAATTRAKLTKEIRLTAGERDEIEHVIAMRQAAGLPQYQFDQEFVMTLLRAPTAVRTSTANFADISITSTSMPSTVDLLSDPIAPCPGLEATAHPNLPNPLRIASSPARKDSRRISVSSSSSNDSGSSFFIPSTTQVRFPVGRATKPTDPKVATCDWVLQYRCESCPNGPQLTRRELQ
ncbi:ankyrin repeat-containing domain protein [Clohesyomyces aquaticus]|uniref:Ankyrin repeat-containing domain protein n=1 Tax=Clohesyomyces aquaticus TaxID=1231657 RepID=A0A1Y1ZNW4_9PLEO|nr:ankyrin repeat-containing domain protein [Clohesyomyces aquaticus]